MQMFVGEAILEDNCGLRASAWSGSSARGWNYLELMECWYALESLHDENKEVLIDFWVSQQQCLVNKVGIKKTKKLVGKCDASEDNAIIKRIIKRWRNRSWWTRSSSLRRAASKTGPCQVVLMTLAMCWGWWCWCWWWRRQWWWCRGIFWYQY